RLRSGSIPRNRCNVLMYTGHDVLEVHMQRKRLVGASLGIVLCALLAPAILFGQYGSGAILGTVTDPTGAVIPGATVTAKNSATNEVRTFTTDAEGFYRFSAVPNGTYTISVTAPSFRTAALSNVVVTVNTQVRADIVMQVGNINEKVEVKDTTPQLQTNTAAMGGVIDNR